MKIDEQRSESLEQTVKRLQREVFQLHGEVTRLRSELSVLRYPPYYDPYRQPYPSYPNIWYSYSIPNYGIAPCGVQIANGNTQQEPKE